MSFGIGYKKLGIFFILFTIFIMIFPEALAEKMDLELFDKTENNKTIRIIVELESDIKSQTKFSAKNEITNQQKIKDVQDQLLQTIDIQTAHKFKYTPYISARVDKNNLGKLFASPLVKSIYEDKIDLLSLSNSVPVIGADSAHTLGFTGQGKTVAILDTGVDKIHPMLVDKVVSEACYTQNDPPNSFGCPNGMESQLGDGAAIPCTVAGCDHGTHVTGIAAGKEFDGLVGIAPDANIIAIQVFTSLFSEDDCGIGNAPCIGAFHSDQIKAMERVYDLRNDFHIASVNLSLGSGLFVESCDSDPRKQIIDMLRSVGIATIAASGNNGFPIAMHAPACISSAISVGATTNSDQIWISGLRGSNTASFLDLLAPGRFIQSAVPGGGFGVKSGTSMATAHVTGAWAILKQLDPYASVDQILSALEDSGKLIVDTRPSNAGQEDVIKPRIQVDQALLALQVPVGGTMIPLEHTSLFLVYIQDMALWLIPFVIAIVGTLLILASRFTIKNRLSSLNHHVQKSTN